MKLRAHWFVIVFTYQLSLAMVGQGPCDHVSFVHEAEIAYRNTKEFKEGIKWYKRAFEGRICDGSIYLDAISCAAMGNDSSSIQEFVGLAIVNGIPPESISRLWLHLGNGIDSSWVWKAVDSTQLKEKHCSKCKADFLRKLKVMQERDQRYRSQNDYSMEAQRSLDSLNWMELKSLVLATGGLPTYASIGFEGSENLSTLFYHMDKSELLWLLPFIVAHEGECYSNLGHVFLYQLDRIGMDEGLVYTIRDNTLLTLGARTKMKNGFLCQNFGEWFDETSLIDGKVYETPFDPLISIEEVDEIRAMFCLPKVAKRRMQRPWVTVSDRATFEKMIVD